MFKIEKNVAIPARSVWSTKYPFGEMEVGDSFDIGDFNIGAVRSAASNYGKVNGGKKYRVLKAPPDGNYRCWRVK